MINIDKMQNSDYILGQYNATLVSFLKRNDTEILPSDFYLWNSIAVINKEERVLSKEITWDLTEEKWNCLSSF